MVWRLLADTVVVVHALFIAFVVAGGLLALRWRRVAYLHIPAAIYGVLIQVFGFTCPLTPLEKALRTRAGSSGYDGGFVEHYVIPLVYPGEFTTGVKLVLAALVAGVNVVVYATLWRRGRPRQAAAVPRTGAKSLSKTLTRSN